VAGTLRGTGQHWLRLMYVANEDDIKPGDTISTSKLSTLFPAGLPLGDVVSVNTSENGLMLDIKVKPRVNFKTLDRFLILKVEE
jgi:rod shape-determining protein MreC